MTHRLIFVLLLITVLITGVVSAQTGSGGQICVRAFEDRNGNGMDDGSEPRITRGLSATLTDDTGIIIDSRLMEDSLNASTGTLCFQRLDAGQYSLRVASADYSATTPVEFVTAITETGVQVFNFGGQLIVSEMPQAQGGSADLALTETEQRNLIVRLIFGAIGAAVVVGGMALMGAVIYLLFLRTSSPTPAYTRATGTHPVVPPSTPAINPMQHVAIQPDDTDRNAPILFEDDDTNENTTIGESEDVPDDFQFSDDPDSPFKPPAN